KYHKNKNEKNVSIWPDVIREAERRTGGDPDIINDPEIAPVVDKPDVGRTGSKKRSSLPVGGQRGQGSRHSLPAGHFSGGSVNSPRRGTSVSDDGSNEASHHTRVYFIQRLAPKADNDPESELYVCDLCDIRTADLERYVIHYKLNHIRRISSGRSQPPARSLPGPSKPKKERKRKEENASPIVKKRKKKSVVVREESPHPEVREEPPNVHERSMECEQILKDWSDEDEEIKEGGKSSPPEDVAVDENSVPQPIVEPEDSLAIKNGTSGDTGESNSKTAEASVPPKSSSCFDFDDEESTQPEVQTLKFGQKLPRVISPEKSKSTATDILSEGLESFLNEVAVPELPSIPSLKHACSSPKRFREGKKPLTSPARETDKKNKEESGLSTSSHQTIDDAKDATAEIQSEDKHFLVEGPLQSKKRKGFGLTEGAEDGSAGKKQKSSGDDEPSKKDDALETGDDVLKSGDDGHLEKLEILPEAGGGDSKLIGSLSEPVKVEIPSDLNDSKSDCASKSKSSISELDKQSLIDTLTYSPSSVDNDFSLKKRKKKRGKDELLEKTRRNESKNSGSIVSENKKSLNKPYSPPSDDSSTTRRKNKRRTSKIPSETPKLEHQKTPDTTNLRSGSKDESPSSRSRSCKSKGTPKTQTKEKRWEGSPDAKSKSKSPRTKKSRYSRRGDSECQGLDDDGQSIHEASSATHHSGTSPKQMKTGKSKKSLEKKDKSDLDQAPKLDSAEKTKNESSTVSTKSKEAAGDTGSINKDLRTSSIIDEERAIDDQTIIASESDQHSVHSSRLRSSKGVLQDRSPSQKTEIEESKKEKDSKKEAKSDGNSEDTDRIRSAESDSMASDLTSQKPTENSKIGLEKNEFLEVSKLMPLKQNETPKPSVVEGSDTMRSPTVGELATPVKREKKSRDKAESSKKKDRKRDAESRNQRQEETPCKESKLHSTRRSKESILSYDKSPSKTVTASVPNDNRRSRSSLSSRSGEKSGRKVESTSSSSKSRVDLKASTPKEDKGHSRNKRSSRLSDSRGETTVESSSVGVPATEDNVKDLKDSTPKEDKRHSRSKRSSRSSDSRGEITVESSSVDVPATEDIVKDSNDLTPKEGDSKSKRSSSSSDSRNKTKKLNLSSSTSGDLPTKKVAKDTKNSTPKEEKGHSRSKRSSRSSDNRGDTTVESKSFAVPATEDVVKDSKDSTSKEDKGHSRSKRSSRSSDNRGDTTVESKSFAVPATEDVVKDSKDPTPEEDKGHSRSKRSSRSSDNRGDTTVDSKSFAVPATEDVVKDSKDSTSKEDKGHSRSKRSSRSSDNRGDTTVESSSIALPATEDVKDFKDSTPEEDTGHSKSKHSSRSSDSRGDTTVESSSVAVPATEDVVKDSKDSTSKEDKGHSRSKRSSRSSDNRGDTTVESSSIALPATEDVKDFKDSTPEEDTGHSKSKHSSRSSDSRGDTTVESSSVAVPATEDIVKDSKDSTPEEDKGHSKSKRSSRSSDSRGETTVESSSVAVPATEDVKDFKDSNPEEDKGHSKSKRSSRSSDSRGETTVQSSSVAVPATEDVKDFKDSTPEEDKGHSKSKRSSRSSDSRGETTVESSSVAVPATEDIVKDSKDSTPKEDKGHSKSKRSSRSSDSRDKTEKSNRSSTRSGDPSTQNVDKDSKNSTPKEDKGHSRSKRSSRSSDSRGDTIVESSSVAVPATEDVKDSRDSAPKEEKGHSRNQRSSRSSDNRGDTTVESKSFAVPATEDVVKKICCQEDPKEEKRHSKSKRSSRLSDSRGDTTVESSSVSVPATEDIVKDSKDSTPKEEKGHSRSKRSRDVIKSSKDTSKSERNLEAAMSNDDELMKTKSSTRSHDTPQEGQKPSSSPGKIVPASLTMNRRSSRSHDGRVNFEESFSSHSKSSIKDPESEKSFATLTELDHKEHSRSKRSLRSRDNRDGKLPSPRENSFPATEIAKDEERSAAATPSATDERDLPGTNLLYVSTDQSVDTVVPNSSPKKRISADHEVPMEMTNKNEIETSILTIVPSSTSVFEDGAKEISEPLSSPSKDIPSTSVEVCEDEGPKKAKLSLSNEFCGPKAKLNDIDESPDSLSMGAPTDGPLSVATLETSTSNEAQLVGACKSLSSCEEKLVDSSSFAFSVPTNDILAEDSGEQSASRYSRKNEATSKETIPSGKSEHRNTIQATSAEETSKVSASSVDFDSLLPMTQVEQKTMIQLSSQSDMLSSNEAHSGTAPIHQESSQDQESSLATPLISESPRDVPAVGSTPRESEAGITVTTTAETNTDSPLNYVAGADLTSRPENDSSMLEKVQSPLAVKMEEKTGGILPCSTTPGKFEIEISTSETIAESSNESLKKDQSPSAEKPKEQIDIPPCLTNSGGFKDELSTVESISEDLQLSEKVREEQFSRVEETVELMKDILPCPAISGGTAKTELSTDDVIPKVKTDEQLGKEQSPSPEGTQVRMDEVLPCDTVPKIEVSTGGVIKELESNPDGEVETFECRKMEESKINFVDSQITQPLVPSIHVSMEEDNVTVSSNSLKEPIDSIASAGSPLKSGTSCKDELQNMAFKKLGSESSKIEADKTEDSIRQGSETAMFEKTPSPTKSVNSCISPEKPKEEPKMLELPQAPQVTARASRWDNPFPMKKSDSRPSTPTNLLLSPTKSVSPANKVKVEIKSGLGRSCFKSPPDLKSTIIDAKQTTVGSSVKVETKQPDRTTNASDFVDELSALQAEIASYSECKVPGSLPKPDPTVETMNADSLRLKTVEVGANARDSKTDKIEKKVEAKCSAPASPMACRKPPEIILKPINVSPSKVLGLSEAALLASLLKGDDEESIQQAANKVSVASPKKDIVKPLQPVAQSVQSPSKAPVFEKPDDNNRGLGKTKSNLLRPIVTNLADIPVVISSIPLPLSEPLITSSHQTPIVIPVEAPKVSTQNQVPNKLCLDDTPTSKVQVLEVERSQPQAGLVGGIDPSKLLDINDIPFVFEEDLIEEGLMPSEPSSMQSIASNLDSVSSTVETQSSSYASEKTNVVSSTANEPEETFAIEDLVEEVVEEEPATDSTLSGNVVTEDEFTTDETSYEDKVYEARQVRQIFIEVTDDTDPNYDFLCSLPIAPFGKYAVEQPSTPAKKVVEAPPIQTKRVTTVTTEPKLISLSNAGKLVSGVSGLSGAPQIIRMQTIKSPADLERQKVQVASGSQPEVSKKPLQLRMVKDAKTGTTKFMVKPQLVQQSGKAACKKLVMSHQIKSLVKSPGNVVTSNAVSTKTPSLIQINKGPLATTKLVPRVTTPSILGQRRVLRHPAQTQRSSSIPIQRPPRSKLTSDFLVGSNAVRLPQDRSGLILSNNNVLPEISSANPVLLSGSNQIVLSSASQPKYVSFVVNKPQEPKKPGKDLLEQALTGLDVQSEEAPNIMPTATVVYGMLTEPLQQRPIMTTAVQPSQVILSHDQLLTFDDPSTPVGETNR
ncbi:hypothetical protein GE061_013780, partial [Apolygus lucorum]